MVLDVRRLSAGCAVSAVTQLANDGDAYRIPCEASGQLPQGQDLFASPERSVEVVED